MLNVEHVLFLPDQGTILSFENRDSLDYCCIKKHQTNTPSVSTTLPVSFCTIEVDL